MQTQLRYSINHMLQGLAFWMAYKSECLTIGLVEADIVSEAAQIFSSRATNYYVRREVDYSTLDDSFSKSQYYADLGIYAREDNSCVGVIEFKLGDNSNGGYKADIKKENLLKRKKVGLTCLVVVAYRKLCSSNIPKALVSNGSAKRGIIEIIPKTQIKVRRICNAQASGKVMKMKRVVCIEII